MQGIAVIQQTLNNLAAPFGGAFTVQHGHFGVLPPAIPGELNIGVFGSFSTSDVLPPGYGAVFLNTSGNSTLTDGTTGSGAPCSPAARATSSSWITARPATTRWSPAAATTRCSGAPGRMRSWWAGRAATCWWPHAGLGRRPHARRPGQHHLLRRPRRLDHHHRERRQHRLCSSGTDQITTGCRRQLRGPRRRRRSVVSQGSDTIVGGSGTATIFAVGPNLTYGGSGPMFFINGSQSSTVIGGTGNGNDVINTGAGAASMRAARGRATSSSPAAARPRCSAAAARTRCSRGVPPPTC